MSEPNNSKKSSETFLLFVSSATWDESWFEASPLIVTMNTDTKLSTTLQEDSSFNKFFVIQGAHPTFLSFEWGNTSYTWKALHKLEKDVVHARWLKLTQADHVKAKVHVSFLKFDTTPRTSEPASGYYFYTREMKKQMKTGDLILFSGRSLMSGAISCITGLPYSSIGMVIRLPDKYTKKEKLYVIEVTEDVDVADAFREDKQGGLCVFDLFKRIHSFEGCAAWWLPSSEKFPNAALESMLTWVSMLHKDPRSVYRTMTPEVSNSIRDLVNNTINPGRAKKIEYSEVLGLQVVVKLLALGGADFSSFQLADADRKILSVLQLSHYRDADKKLLFCASTCHTVHAVSESPRFSTTDLVTSALPTSLHMRELKPSMTMPSVAARKKSTRRILNKTKKRDSSTGSEDSAAGTEDECEDFPSAPTSPRPEPVPSSFTPPKKVSVSRPILSSGRRPTAGEGEVAPFIGIEMRKRDPAKKIQGWRNNSGGHKIGGEDDDKDETQDTIGEETTPDVTASPVSRGSYFRGSGKRSTAEFKSPKKVVEESSESEESPVLISLNDHHQEPAPVPMPVERQPRLSGGITLVGRANSGGIRVGARASVGQANQHLIHQYQQQGERTPPPAPPVPSLSALEADKARRSPTGQLSPKQISPKQSQQLQQSVSALRARVHSHAFQDLKRSRAQTLAPAFLGLSTPSTEERELENEKDREKEKPARAFNRRNSEPSVCSWDYNTSWIGPVKKELIRNAVPLGKGTIKAATMRARTLSLKTDEEAFPEKETYNPSTEDDIQFFSENGVKLISSGTREALLRYLLFNGDDEFLADFFNTTHFWFKPALFLKTLTSLHSWLKELNTSAGKNVGVLPAYMIKRFSDVLHAYIDYNFRSLSASKDLKAVESFLEFLPETDKKDITQLIRLKESGLYDRDLNILGAEIYLDNPNARATFSGQDLVHWVSQQTKGISSEEAIGVCEELVSIGIVKNIKEGKKNKGAAFTTEKFYSIPLDRATMFQAKLNRITFAKADKPPLHTVLDFKLGNFTKQLLYCEHNLFQKVSIEELNYWLKGDSSKRAEFAPNLTILTSFVNTLSQWVVTEIVSTPNLKKRQSILCHFIQMCKACYDIHNYDAALQIIMALQHTAVSRLSMTWKGLSKKYMDLYKQLEVLLSHENNWRDFRNQVDKTLTSRDPTNPVAIVPYIGLYLKDLTAMKDGSGDLLDNGHIAWKIKFKRMADVMRKIELLQEGQCTITPDLEIQQFLLTELFTYPDKMLFEKSKACEASARMIKNRNG